MIWRYLFHGSDVLVMPKTWLADTHRLALYQAAQAKETWAGGEVVRGVEEMRREAFWRRMAGQRATQHQPGRVAQFGGRGW
jgi:hypothetical protein